MNIKRVELTHKSRRLVERAISLAVRKHTTLVTPSYASADTYAERAQKRTDARNARRGLDRGARLAKQVLLERIAELEQQLEANKELRRSRL